MFLLATPSSVCFPTASYAARLLLIASAALDVSGDSLRVHGALERGSGAWPMSQLCLGLYPQACWMQKDETDSRSLILTFSIWEEMNFL